MVATPEGEHDFGSKTLQMRIARGVPHGISKNKAFERRECRHIYINNAPQVAEVFFSLLDEAR